MASARGGRRCRAMEQTCNTECCSYMGLPLMAKPAFESLPRLGQPQRRPPHFSSSLLTPTRLLPPLLMPLGFLFGHICGMLCDGMLQSCATTRELLPTRSRSWLLASLTLRSIGRAFSPWCNCCNCTAPCCSEEDGWEADEEDQEWESGGSEATERRARAGPMTRAPRETDPMLPKGPGSRAGSVVNQR